MTQTCNIVLISNPASGFNRRNGLAEVERIADRHGIAHHRVSNYEDANRVLESLAPRPPDILCINAGDGTVDLVLGIIRDRTLFATEPVFVLLRGGTTNMLHGDCGLGGRPAAALQALAEKQFIATGRHKLVTRHPFDINLNGQPVAPGFFIGTGAIPRAILAARAGLHKWRMTGPIGETLIIAALLLRLLFRPDLNKDAILSPEMISLKLDEKISEQPHVFMGLSSLQRLIGNRKLDKPIDSIGVLFMGVDRKMSKTNTATVSFETASPWMLDGETRPPGCVEVRLGTPVSFITDMQ